MNTEDNKRNQPGNQPVAPPSQGKDGAFASDLPSTDTSVSAAKSGTKGKEGNESGEKAGKTKQASEEVKKPATEAEKVQAKSEESDKKESKEKAGVVEPPTPKAREEVKLSGLYAFKLAMSSIYDEEGNFTPVTFLEVKPWVVSQVKKKEKDGYNSIQVACIPQKNNRCSKALKGHLSPAGFTGGARYVREIRQNAVADIKVGQWVSIHSIKKGDRIKVQAISKGHGFTEGVMRWGFKGGPASHGAKVHRTSGSIGNRTEPARVMPGKKMAGHYGVEKVKLKNVKVMDVISEENLIVVKGPVPGAGNSLVFLLGDSSGGKMA